MRATDAPLFLQWIGILLWFAFGKPWGGKPPRNRTIGSIAMVLVVLSGVWYFWLRFSQA